MARIGTNNTYHAMAPHNFAFATNAFDRSLNSHIFLHNNFVSLLRPENDARFIQVIRRQLYGHLIPGKDPDVMHAHFAGYVAEDNMPIFQLHSKRGIWQILKNLALHLYEIIFRHEAVSLTC